MREGEAEAGSLLGAEPEETIVGPSTTVNLATMARALAPPCVPSDETVVSNLDDEAKIGCWRRMAEARGLRLHDAVAL